MTPVWQPPISTPWLAALKAGQAVAAPAEGVYGYCADPFAPAALEALLALKQRSGAKGFVTLIGNLAQLALLCPDLPPACREAVAAHWQPGQPPVTLILPALPTLPTLLTGGLPTIAIRLPQPDYMREYLNAWGNPLVSTSANLTGQPPATTPGQLDPAIPALTLPAPLSGQTSRILDPRTGAWLR